MQCFVSPVLLAFLCFSTFDPIADSDTCLVSFCPAFFYLFLYWANTVVFTASSMLVRFLIYIKSLWV